MHPLFRTVRRGLTSLFAVGALAGAGIGLASAVPASAATVTGPAYTTLNPGPALAGYEVNGNGLKAYNDVRGTVHIPVGSTSNAALFLQTSTVTGGHTSELALVHNAAAQGISTSCAADQWTLTEGWYVNTAPGPIQLGLLHAVPGPAVCVNAGGSYYLEVHYSTLLRQIAYVAGPNEFGNTNTLNTAFIGFQEFFAPAIGVHYTDASLPGVSTPQASFTRDGLTSLDNPHARAAGTNSRLNLASQSTEEVEAVPGPSTTPTVLNPVFLNTSAFGSGGSFSVTASS